MIVFHMTFWLKQLYQINKTGHIFMLFSRNGEPFYCSPSPFHCLMTREPLARQNSLSKIVMYWLAAARISALGTRKKDRHMTWKVEKFAFILQESLVLRLKVNCLEKRELKGHVTAIFQYVKGWCKEWWNKLSSVSTGGMTRSKWKSSFSLCEKLFNGKNSEAVLLFARENRNFDSLEVYEQMISEMA